MRDGGNQGGEAQARSPTCAGSDMDGLTWAPCSGRAGSSLRPGQRAAIALAITTAMGPSNGSRTFEMA